MQKFPLEKILPIAFYLALIAAIGISGYIELSRRANAPAGPQNQAQIATPIPLAICAESAETICVQSTGYDAEGSLLITFKTGLQPMPPVYGILRDGKREIPLDCRMVDISPRLLYCFGPFRGDTASARIELYRSENSLLLASGLLVPGEMALARQPTPLPTGTPASYPGLTPPAYPSYPSYP